GMNTGIGDVMNLCWKLAAVRQGWAGPRLIESYETERRPMGVRNSQLGVRCTRVMDGWILPKNFEDDGATADAARRVFGAQIIREARPQYPAAGIQPGERYETSPIVWPDEDDAPPDTWDTYTPIDRPGARAAFLADAGTRRLRRIRKGLHAPRFRRARGRERHRGGRARAPRAAQNPAARTAQRPLSPQARADSPRSAHRLAPRRGRPRNGRDRSHAWGLGTAGPAPCGSVRD